MPKPKWLRFFFMSSSEAHKCFDYFCHAMLKLLVDYIVVLGTEGVRHLKNK